MMNFFARMHRDDKPLLGSSGRASALTDYWGSISGYPSTLSMSNHRTIIPPLQAGEGRVENSPKRFSRIESLNQNNRSTLPTIGGQFSLSQRERAGVRESLSDEDVLSVHGEGQSSKPESPTFHEKPSFNFRIAVLILAASLITTLSAHASEPGTIQMDSGQKLVTLADGQGDLVLRLNYDARCVLDRVFVRGNQVAADSGVCTGIRENGQWFTTRDVATPVISAHKDTLSVTGIVFGPPGAEVRETWQFTVGPEQIIWRINRIYSTDALVEDAAFPEWDFGSLSDWTGGLLDNGGVVLDKYLETTNATYGAHFGTVTFWNSQLGDCLRITPHVPNDQFAAGRFSHQANGVFSFNYVVSDKSAKPKHSLMRFLKNRQDVWAPFNVKRSEVSEELTLTTLDYSNSYDRGRMPGIDSAKVGELLNTVARYGVIDQQLVGGNGWRSGYICLHEPFFAEMGLALDEADYITNFSECLDYERDHAITADGRVKSRWCHTSGDAMRGMYDDSSGFYETRWGMLLDSQPDYVINVAEQFDLTGNRRWLAGEKSTCENALNYLMRREVGNTGLVAMMNDSVSQKKSSDWIDVVWAAYENAFVNAGLYEALCLWANDEDMLGDPGHAATYRDFAARLKTSFNRPISDGGFWDPTNQWYVYWRDKDGSIHGNNLVEPVNFAAIAYGICDDPSRKAAILNRMEHEMQKEDLFSWPLCFFPYQPEEGGGSPFPSYENGDIFLSWNELAIRAYSDYKPDIAVKYVKNILARYDDDGLSYQRYLRKSQEGAGGDILAGNCMAIVGLYRDIYGIQPKPDRLLLDPHLTGDLDGTELHYQLRGVSWLIDLATNDYAANAGGFTLRDSNSFGVNVAGHELQYFPRGSATWAMAISRDSLSVQINSWPDNPESPREWTETAPLTQGKTFHRVAQLRPGVVYELKIDGRVKAFLRADRTGRIEFTSKDGYVPTDLELFPATPRHGPKVVEHGALRRVAPRAAAQPASLCTI